jgi:hypothetical protein
MTERSCRKICAFEPLAVRCAQASLKEEGVEVASGFAADLSEIASQNSFSR